MSYNKNEIYEYYGIDNNVAMESAIDTIKTKVSGMIEKIKVWIIKIKNWIVGYSERESII